MENNNKKVVLIGGSNGIGLAIGKKLLDCGYGSKSRPEKFQLISRNMLAIWLS